MNKFEKVSFEQWMKDACKGCEFCEPQEVFMARKRAQYDAVILPKRGTKKSAGYDFVSPVNIELAPGEVIVIFTAIKAMLDDNKYLELLPRSGQGCKFHIRLSNTAGIVDSDYYGNPNNDGHIMIQIRNEGDSVFKLSAGERFAQGIIQTYYTTDDDDASNDRIGGIGSTGTKAINNTLGAPLNYTEDSIEVKFDKFEKDVCGLINANSLESICGNTPDFIIAAFLRKTLEAYSKASVTLNNWKSK